METEKRGEGRSSTKLALFRIIQNVWLPAGGFVHATRRDAHSVLSGPLGAEGRHLQRWRDSWYERPLRCSSVGMIDSRSKPSYSRPWNMLATCGQPRWFSQATHLEQRIVNVARR